MSDPTPLQLFVYGTLRPGSAHPMAHRLARESRHLGAAQVAGSLFDVGDYPALVPPTGKGDRVRGDLLLLPRPQSTLAWLDEYEGCAGHEPPPHEYRRELWPVEGAQGLVRAWVYVWNRPTGGLRSIFSGDYLGRG